MLSSYRAIFFDAGGTLFYPYPSIGEIYQRVAAHYGCRVDANEIERHFRHVWVSRDGLSSLESHSDGKLEREWWRKLVYEVFSQLGGVQEFEAFFDELYDVFARPESWRLYSDVVDVLSAFKAKNKCLGIVSNWDSRLFQLCEGLGVTPYFDFILASAVVGFSKPSPHIFQKALEKSKAKPSEAVHIGDSLEDDIAGANRLGISSILIHRGQIDPDRGQEGLFPGVKVIQNLKELLHSPGT